MKTIALLAILALLVGCSPAQQVKVQQDVQDIVKPIQQTTLADAQAALVIYQAAGDQAGVQCTTDIINFLNNYNVTVPVVNGVLSGIAAARTFKAPSIPENIHRDCAVIVLDAQTAALRLGLPIKP